MEKSLFTVQKTLKKVLKIMNKIRLVDFLKILYSDEVVKIYKIGKNKLEGYTYICASNPKDLLESDGVFVIDTNIYVTSVVIKADKEYGHVLEIYCKGDS